jgi:hypothetical protein
VVVGLHLWVGGCGFAVCDVWVCVLGGCGGLQFAVVVGDRFGSGFAVHFGLGLMVVTGFG